MDMFVLGAQFNPAAPSAERERQWHYKQVIQKNRERVSRLHARYKNIMDKGGDLERFWVDVYKHNKQISRWAIKLKGVSYLTNADIQNAYNRRVKGKKYLD